MRFCRPQPKQCCGKKVNIKWERITSATLPQETDLEIGSGSEKRKAVAQRGNGYQHLCNWFLHSHRQGKSVNCVQTAEITNLAKLHYKTYERKNGKHLIYLIEAVSLFIHRFSSMQCDKEIARQNILIILHSTSLCSRRDPI